MKGADKQFDKVRLPHHIKKLVENTYRVDRCVPLGLGLSVVFRCSCVARPPTLSLTLTPTWRRRQGTVCGADGPSACGGQV